MAEPPPGVAPAASIEDQGGLRDFGKKKDLGCIQCILALRGVRGRRLSKYSITTAKVSRVTSCRSRHGGARARVG